MYFIIKTTYVGLKPQQNFDSDTIRISRDPVLKLPVSDWSVYVHGEFDTLEAARAAISRIFGEVRNADPYGEDYDTVMIFKPGKYIPMSIAHLGTWCYSALQELVHLDNDQDSIQELVDDYKNKARGLGYDLNVNDLLELIEEHKHNY